MTPINGNTVRHGAAYSYLAAGVVWPVAVAVALAPFVTLSVNASPGCGGPSSLRSNLVDPWIGWLIWATIMARLEFPEMVLLVLCGQATLVATAC